MRSRLFLLLPLAGLALAFLLHTLPAQTVGGTEDVAFRFDGQAVFDELGYSVAHVGDVNGDGVPDLFVGAPQADPNGLSEAGSATLFSGATGAQLRRWDGSAAFDWLGFSVAGAGDVDGDGVPDVIVGAPFANRNGLTSAGSAFVFSGATGAQLFRFDGSAVEDFLGTSVAGAGDVDGDGVPDLIVGAPFADPNGISDAGSVFVFSGAAGVQLFRFDGQAAVDELGFSVAGAGDVNGDGRADLIAGARLADPNGLGDAGSAFVFSGATGTQLFRRDGLAAGDQLGQSVAAAGDVDGDGRPDWIAGAPLADPSGFVNAGSAFVFSGATGAQLLRLDGQAAGDQSGQSVAGGGDFNGDGRADLIVGAPLADPNGRMNSGSARVFSGAAGVQLFSLDGMQEQVGLGHSVAAAGDVDGDGRADLIVGAPFTVDVVAGPGSAFVFTFNPILTATEETFSVSAGGTLYYMINFPDVDAGQKYGILLSARGTGPTLLQGLLIPLKKDGFFVASTKGKTPSQGTAFQGILGLHGEALAYFSTMPGTLPNKLIGRSIFLAVVNKKLDFASVARRIDFTP